MPVAYVRSHKDKHRPVARLLHFATSDGSGATFRYTRRRTLHTGSYTLFLRVYPLLELPTHTPCVVRRQSVTLEISYDGIHLPHRFGGLLQVSSVLWQNHKRPNHSAKEVTRKSYFGTVSRQSDVCLAQRQRGHAKIILCHSAICHARVHLPLRTPTLRYTSQSPLPTQRTFEDSHTSHLPTQTAQDRP